MKIIDLTHEIYPDMPVFPGTVPPRLKKTNTMEKDGFIETIITMSSHTGTHVDAPAHMLKDGRTLDTFVIEHFAGNAVVLDFTNRNIKQIEVSDLKTIESMLNVDVQFVILKTGWSQYWGTPKYYEGFPYLSDEAAEWLTNYSLKGIGIDTISIDSMDSTVFSVHKIFMRHNILIIENLDNLASINSKRCLFAVMPIKTKLADGSPARAIVFQP